MVEGKCPRKAIAVHGGEAHAASGGFTAVKERVKGRWAEEAAKAAIDKMRPSERFHPAGRGDPATAKPAAANIF